MQVEKKKGDLYEIKNKIRKKYFLYELSLTLLILFVVAIATTVLFFFLTKLHLIGENWNLTVYGSLILLFFISAMILSKRRWTRYVQYDHDSFSTITLFGKVNKKDLNQFEVRPFYTVSKSNNQLIEYKFEIIDRETEEPVDYMCDKIPLNIFKAILEYYGEDTSIFNDREIKELTLSKEEKSHYYLISAIIFFFLALTFFGSLIAIKEQKYIIPSLISLVVSIGLSIYIIKKWVHIIKNR